MAQSLYVVATPLGNLEDLSPRARRVLQETDWIACEDTRRSGRLLEHLGVDRQGRPLISYHEHNEEERTPQLLRRLQDGQSGALVSDAGTPLLSDPGYRLVRACRQAGIEVVPIPGPSAAVAALSVSGLPCDRFLFAGFPPPKATAQRRFFEELAAQEVLLIFYLSPHKLASTLKRMREVLGERRAFLARELTKLHETHYLGTLGDIIGSLQAETPRGEYTLLVEGASGAGESEPHLDAEAYVEGLQRLRGLSRADAVRQAAQELGIPRGRLYRKVHRRKKNVPSDV
ncbi:MAG TPA: 16S rRNA (cytidine(1402)-2'-O)-methyltransferase [Acidobacteriota bacterium]|nr:16S rRNA (cytidine(1402)-2'-O)-methyltransferase [Acidobacteriota bacterium]